MRRLFISDLHLSPTDPALIKLVCDFLQSQQSEVDEIYILGDIFNLWLGDDLVPSQFEPFVTTLQNLSAKGISLNLMVGNRDFMLGKDFAKTVNANLLGDSHQINFGRHRALLLHGDTLCLDDISYQRYRKIVRSRLFRWCSIRLPQGLRRNISDQIIAKSKQQKQHKTAMMMDVNQAEVVRVIKVNHIEILIHGHTHRPGIHQLEKPGDQTSYRLVLGDWVQNHASYLLADDQHLTLHDHRLETGRQTLQLF